MLTAVLRRRRGYVLQVATYNYRYLATASPVSRPTSARAGKTVAPLENWDRGARTQKTSLTPMYNSVKKLIDSNPSCVSLIQVGSFYELYFEQAEEYAPKLGLKLAKKKTSNHVIPFAGFPLSQLKRFTEMLIQEQKVNVAIVDQCSRGSKTDLQLVHRKISRIVTPGTLIDELFLNFSENNYLLAIYFPPNAVKLPPDPDMTVGLSWIDISVGESFVQQTTLGQLGSDLSRINPSEILIPKDLQNKDLHLGKWYAPLQELKRYLLRFHTVGSYGDLKQRFESHIQKTRKLFEDLSPKEQTALNMVLSYISINLPDANVTLELPTRYFNEDCLQMDSRTREALELTERAIVGRTSAVGSLISTIKKTCTSSGTRMLNDWIKSPLLDIEQIEHRQEYVDLFLKNEYLKIITRQQLQQLGDFIRNLQRLVVGNGDVATHLIYTATSLQKLQALRDFLSEEHQRNPQKTAMLEDFLDKFKVPNELAEEIFNIIHTEKEQESTSIETEEIQGGELEMVETKTKLSSYGNDFSEKYRVLNMETATPEVFYSVRKDHNEALRSLHDELTGLRDKEAQFMDSLRGTLNQVDAKLTLSKKEVLGRYVNAILISGKSSAIENLSRKLNDDIIYTKKTSLLYRTKEWNDLQHDIAETRSSILAIEEQIMQELKEKVVLRFPEFRELSRLVDFLDVTASFAILAEENNWTCPKLIRTPRLSIEGGRHVVVESSLKASGTMFIANDSNMGQEGNLWVILGPNMGGKSTFLRQNALIVILAQMGSYVPADRARIGIVDRIFTRIGASDDLYNDMSTFMVEMVETSNILNHATPRSLAIVDEIGRGTSGKEGIAIAYATLLGLLNVNKCRTLFATHFGKELEELLTANGIDQSNVRYFRTRVVSNNDQYFIDHSLEPGISERSHALEVARMAGFPEKSLHVAEQVLSSL
ncbi:DNA mismatch repair protein MSH1, mitochondrial [Candida viswanathii]|uniref:DNA mismatch repair protein MSH1, mitochondrial n=1 Tax=Candida viswanathii TaxID=5486 RepID=A0A367Y1L6_9ASCO|nr:DNA mismatch repair protein MSH1, mitochondrial [Candida viswanathii]